MEQLMKYKWPALFIVLLGLNIGWNIYSNQTDKGKIYLREDSSIEENYDEGESQLDIVKKEEEIKEDKVLGSQQETDIEVLQPFPVYICGEIANPGVYYMSKDAIINEVIEKSGGFTKEADQLAVNLAAPVMANEKIIIPKQGEEIDKLIDSYDNRERTEAGDNSQETVNSPQKQLVNINSAPKEILMTLNGIGEVRASAIIAYRQENGLFSSIDEIKNISGIGEKTFEKIKQFITT